MWAFYNNNNYSKHFLEHSVGLIESLQLTYYPHLIDEESENKSVAQGYLAN